MSAPDNLNSLIEEANTTPADLLHEGFGGEVNLTETSVDNIFEALEKEWVETSPTEGLEAVKVDESSLE